MSNQSSGEEHNHERQPKKIKRMEPTSQMEDPTIQEQIYMAKLFKRVLIFVQRHFVVGDTAIASSISDINEKFKSFDYLSINFNKSEYLCGYFYRYALLNTSLARNRYLDAMRNCSGLKKKLRKSELNIVSLGGGPGTDIVGFCSSFYECTIPQKRVNLTIIDIVKRWGSFYNLIEFFIKDGNYGNCSGLFEFYNVCSTFMCVDLREVTPPRRYLHTLKLADIVLLARVLDAFNRKDDKPLVILQKIVQRMKKGALLLVIDSHPEQWNTAGLKKIYVSNLSEFSLNVTMKERYTHTCALTAEAEIAVYEKI